MKIVNNGLQPATIVFGMSAAATSTSQSYPNSGLSARDSLTDSPRCLLPVRIRAVRVLPMASRNGVASSGAVLANCANATEEIFKRVLAVLATTSAERGPWSKREMSPKKSPTPKLARVVSSPATFIRTLSSP